MLSQPGNLLRALQVHVRGFIPKDAPAETLAAAISKVGARNRIDAIRVSRNAGWL